MREGEIERYLLIFIKKEEMKLGEGPIFANGDAVFSRRGQ